MGKLNSRVFGYIERNPIVLLFIGIGIRLALMPIMASPDTMVNSTIGLLLASKGQIVLSDQPTLQAIVYAATFKVLGLFYNFNHFDIWIQSVQFFPGTLQSCYFFNQPNITTFIFAAKVPLLLFDLLLALALLKLFPNPHQQMLALIMWAFNPVDLYVTFMQGEPDIIMVSLLALSYYFYERGRISGSLLSLAGSIAFKVFSGIFFIPYLLGFFREKKVKPRSLAIPGIVSVVVLVIAFSLTNPFPVFYQSVNAAAQPTDFSGFYGSQYFYRGAVGSPLLGGLFTYVVSYSPVLSIFGGFTNIYIMPLLLVVAILLFLYSDKFGASLLFMISTILALYYASSLFHSQWFLWFQPFLVILVVTKKVPLSLFALITALYFGYISYWNSAVTTSLIAPLIPNATFWKGPIDYLSMYVNNPGAVIDLVRTSLSGAMIFLIGIIYLRRNE